MTDELDDLDELDEINEDDADDDQPESPVEVDQPKSLDEIAAEVRKGLWGKGQDRRLALSRAGYDHIAVQKAALAQARGH